MPSGGRTVLPSKKVGETFTAVFDFASSLNVTGAGETISGAAVTISVYSGTDAAPNSVLNGAASISGSQILQSLTAGTAGVIYSIVAQATTSTSQVLQMNALLAVEADTGGAP